VIQRPGEAIFGRPGPAVAMQLKFIILIFRNLQYITKRIRIRAHVLLCSCKCAAPVHQNKARSGHRRGGEGAQQVHMARERSLGCVCNAIDQPGFVFSCMKRRPQSKKLTHLGGQPPGARSNVTRSEGQYVGYLKTTTSCQMGVESV